MADQPYPHSRNDCDSCREFDADMAGHFDGLTVGDPKWCQRCAGHVLTKLVLTGHTVSVYALDSPKAYDPDTNDGPVPWTVDLAEEVLRLALPSGSVFLRALINEGGTATAARLKEVIGSDALHYMTLTLNGAAKKVARTRQLGRHRHLALPRRDPTNPRKEAVYDYELPDHLIPIFDEALRRLDR
jgi:hypothetical protein